VKICHAEFSEHVYGDDSIEYRTVRIKITPVPEANKWKNCFVPHKCSEPNNILPQSFNGIPLCLLLQPFLHEYGEPLDAELQVYALEEIVAEKLRAILQHIHRLEERGWSRSRARDYYDLWRVLGTYRNAMDFSDFASLLRTKCAARNVAFNGPQDFFQERMLAYVEKTWEQWLGPLVPRLPTFHTVIGELRPQVAALIPAMR